MLDILPASIHQRTPLVVGDATDGRHSKRPSKQ
jgi:hypothetical protein